MNRKILLVTMLALFCNTMFSEEPKQWTLCQCIDYALENNISLKKSSLTKQSATEDLKQSKAALFPSLNASTSHSLGYRPWVNDNVSTVSNGTVSTSVDKSYYNGSYGINASWTLFNGGQNIKTIKLNSLTEQQAELDSATTANSIQEQIAQLYVQILYLKEVIEVNKQSYETSCKNEERGKVMVEAGNMSRVDLAQLVAQKAQDQYSIVEAESNLASSKLQLKQLLEIIDDQEFDICTPDASDEKALGDIPALNDVYQTALQQRPEIANSLLAVESSELNVSIAKSGWWPSISLSGSLGTSTSSMSDKKWDNQFKTNFDMGVGASLNIPIFNNRSTKTAIRKAKIQYMQSVLDLQEKKEDLYSTVEGYWLDANTNQAKFRAAMASTESEQESFDLLSEQFRQGLKNIIELMTGKNNLLTAQQNRLQSKYSAILYIQLLNFYMGKTLDI